MGRRLTATKLAAVGIAALLALLALLWYQTRDGAAAPTVQPRDPQTAIAERAAIADVSFQRAVKRSEELRADIPPGKIDPRSDEFYARFDRAMPRAVSRAAMRNCYHGGLSRQDRDAFITVDFVDHVTKSGDVSVSDVKIVRSTLTDKALEACMVKEIAATRWHDDALPEWTQEDSVVITPERVVHKYNDDDDDGAAAPADTPRMTSPTK